LKDQLTAADGFKYAGALRFPEKLNRILRRSYQTHKRRVQSVFVPTRFGKEFIAAILNGFRGWIRQFELPGQVCRQCHGFTVKADQTAQLHTVGVKMGANGVLGLAS
jgi:hypothetical protein